MEPRRVEMVTIVPQNQQKSEKVDPTIRFTLTLTESNDETCPEFSYAELWKNALDEREQDENDPFSKSERAEEDKMAAMAKSFEAKYGQPTPRKTNRRRSDRMQDLVDLGDGYDETDPFVDNSEAYDELVPATVTTKHGGFYINAGCLDFRAFSDDSADAFKLQSKRQKHRNGLGSETGGEIKKKRGPKRKKKKRGKWMKKKLLEGAAGEEMKKKWKRMTSASDAAKNFIRRKKLKAKELASAAKSLRPPSPPPVAGQNGFSHARKNYIDSDSDNDSSAAFAMETAPTIDPETSAKYESVIDSVISQQVSPEIVEEEKEKGMTEMEAEETKTKLPSSLPQSLVEAVAKIKQAATESEEGKCKFFNSRVNDLLLQIETESRQLSCGMRMTIYSHLAGHLPCGKETLVKRAKKLRLNQQDYKLRDPLTLLRDAISAVMPALLEKHQADCLTTSQAKERLSESKADAVRESRSTESEEDAERSQDGEKQKRIVAPRRKFEWNAEIRQLLCNVVRVKMEIFQLSNIRSQQPEEYLRAFLDAEVKPLWPQGWMQTRMLFKETRSVHMRWTNPTLLKPKKNILPITPGVSASGASGGEPLHVFTSPASILSTCSVLPTAKTDERPPGGVEQKSSPPRSAPTLLDYASQSFMSAARSKTSSSSAASESNTDTYTLSPSMPRLKPEKPVAPPDGRPRLTPDAFLDHFKAFTQQQLINRARSLVKPGVAASVPQGAVETTHDENVNERSMTRCVAEFPAERTDNRVRSLGKPAASIPQGVAAVETTHDTNARPRCVVDYPADRTETCRVDSIVSPSGDNRTNTVPTNVLVATTLMVSPPKHVTPPKQMAVASDHALSVKEPVHIGDPAGGSTVIHGQKASNILSQVSTSQVLRSLEVLGSNAAARLQQKGYLSGERTISGQVKDVLNTVLKQRSPPGHVSTADHRSPVYARQTEASSIAADVDRGAKLGAVQPRRLSDVGQSHGVRGMVATSGEKELQSVMLGGASSLRRCSLEQVSHGATAPIAQSGTMAVTYAMAPTRGVVRHASAAMKLQPESCGIVAPPSGTERHTSVVSSGQQMRHNVGQEMRHGMPPGGVERQVSSVVSNQISANVGIEQRANVERRRLSLTPPASSNVQRSPSMFGIPSSSSPRQPHHVSADRSSLVSRATPRLQQPRYGGLTLNELHQQALAVNNKSYVKQTLGMVPSGATRTNHGDVVPLSTNSSSCSSPSFWSTPLTHPLGGSPATPLPPSPVFPLVGDRSAPAVATTAAMFSLPCDVPSRRLAGYPNLLNLPSDLSPPQLNHPSLQHPALHLNGSPEHVTGNNIFGHAVAPHGSPHSGHNTQGMTSQYGVAPCYSPRHPLPPMSLSFGNPFTDPNQPQHRY